ncbi:MAG: helix-turn-helix transcriptional regulator [Leptospiraceae bacterium]|nr:helix-turn-helix transcriptional regulator [Leptospiraceae bacterium]
MEIMQSGIELQQALVCFDALSQETRLQALRRLVQAGPSGMPAGELSASLDVPHNTLSFHLNHMSNAGLVQSNRQGRSIIYSINFDTLNGLMRFMMEDCCGLPSASVANSGGDCIPNSSSCCREDKQ